MNNRRDEDDELAKARCKLFRSGAVPPQQMIVLEGAFGLWLCVMDAKKNGFNETAELLERHALELAGAAWREVEGDPTRGRGGE